MFNVLSDGGCTMNCRGIVIRCGEHEEHTTLPHFLQWCFLNKKVKYLPHTGHCETSESGCQRGKTISLCLLAGAVFGCGESDGGGKGGRGGRGGRGGSDDRDGAGDESNTMGSELVLPVLFECILMLDGRLMGASAVVKRRLRSELRDEDESVRGGKGRFGRV